MSYKVRLGNPAPHLTKRQTVHDEQGIVVSDEKIRTALPPLESGEERVVEIESEPWEKPEGLDPFCLAARLTPYEVLAREIESLWGDHGADLPSWVEANDPDLEAYLALRLGCPRRRDHGNTTTKSKRGAK
jgi:hypothetical protein